MKIRFFLPVCDVGELGSNLQLVHQHEDTAKMEVNAEGEDVHVNLQGTGYLL
jgi:hypothetical protein